MRDLEGVGPSKPIGYLPLRTITEILRIAPASIAADAAARGLASVQFGPEECCFESGAFYVYHREALSLILHARSGSVRAAGLPLDPDRFVARIASVWFEQDHPALSIIATAFGGHSRE